MIAGPRTNSLFSRSTSTIKRDRRRISLQIAWRIGSATRCDNEFLFIRREREKQLTWICFLGCLDFLVDDDQTDGDRREQIDNEGKKRMKNEKEKVKCRPEESIARGNVQNTDRSLTLVVGLSGERFVEEEFIEITDEHTEEDQENETTSNVRLFQPLTTQEECRVETFDGDERCQPINHSRGRGMKVIQRFTKMIVGH